MSHLMTAMCPKCWCICCVIFNFWPCCTDVPSDDSNVPKVLVYLLCYLLLFLIFGLAVRMSHQTTAMCPKCWCICCYFFNFWPCYTDVPSDDSNVSKVLVYLLCYYFNFWPCCTDVPSDDSNVSKVLVYLLLFFNFWPCCTDVPSDDRNVPKVLVYLLCYLLLFLIFGLAVRMSHLTTAMCPKCWCICCYFLIFGLAVRMSHLTTAMCPKCWCICCYFFKFLALLYGCPI